MLALVILIFLVSYKKTKEGLKIIYHHFKGFFKLDHDPIQNCNSVQEIAALKATRPMRSLFYFPGIMFNLHYLPGALAMIYYHLDNLYVLVVDHGGHYNATGMPELLMHRVTQQIFWDLMDVMLVAANTQSLFIYLHLTFMPSIDSDHFMFAVWNESIQKRTIYYQGKFWKQTKSDEILKRHNRLKRIYTFLIVPVILQLYMYYIPYHFGKGDILSFRNMWITLYLHPWMLYTAYADIYMSFCFHLVTNNLQYKQQSRLNKINALMSEMYLVAQGKHPNKNIDQLRSIIWMKFLKCNQKNLNLFKEIGIHCQFWSPILTNYVFGYVVMICYFAYTMFQGEVDVITKKSLQIFFSALTIAIIMLITSECSIIVRKSVAIYKTNRQFAYLFSRTLQPNSLQLLQLSKLISNYKGTRVGFRYINNAIIDSRMFEILFLSISVLYMKIFTKKIMGQDYIG